ncbi:MAG: hypothetical protein KUF80_04840 [Candidatus Thiodiazotropha sp. (ex Codakia orbicularis)]|nr:hypothetical protein [Candidatus Thiodiazotropha sp. (ex Codakia orbicularis)]
MKMLHMFFLTLLIASQPAISSTPTDLQLQRLVKSIGMYEQLAEQMRVLEQQTESTARQLTEKVYGDTRKNIALTSRIR